MTENKSFPLKGIIGVVANSIDEISLAASKGLQCVELRADLLLDGGLSLEQVLATIQLAKQQRLATLFTLRHPSHGGKFSGTETERVTICRQALAAGAEVIDLEYGTDSATQMLSEAAPLILSYHDFNSMPDATELSRLTTRMQNEQPLAIKVVPTSSTLSQAARMLTWVEAIENNVVRIGFSMGESGACSRILTIAHGAPITYASFGAAVAPGQVPLDELLSHYRAMSLNSDTNVIALIGSNDTSAHAALEHNKQTLLNSVNEIAIAFHTNQQEELEEIKDTLRITEIRSV